MDGANKATWPIIMKEFPWIICTWCVAHVIDLWFEDVGKMTFFKDIWEQGKMVVIWIRGHQAFAAKFGKLTRKSLLLPGTGNLLSSLCIGADVNVMTLVYRRYTIRDCIYHA